jgi:hypothetical protein
MNGRSEPKEKPAVKRRAFAHIMLSLHLLRLHAVIFIAALMWAAHRSRSISNRVFTFALKDFAGGPNLARYLSQLETADRHGDAVGGGTSLLYVDDFTNPTTLSVPSPAPLQARRPLLDGRSFPLSEPSKVLRSHADLAGRQRPIVSWPPF